MTRITDAAVVAAAEALLAAGFVDPDDGTIPKWLSDGNPIPVWTHPSEAVKVALAAALPHLEGATPVAPQVIADAIETLESTGCVFWACEGPNVPFEGMKTCKVCSTIQDLREAVAAGVFGDAGPVVPDHVHCEHRDTQPDEYGAMRCTHCGLVFS